MCRFRAIFHRHRYVSLHTLNVSIEWRAACACAQHELIATAKADTTSPPTPFLIYSYFHATRLNTTNDLLFCYFFQTLFLHKCGCLVVVWPSRAYRHFIGDIIIGTNRTAWPPQLANLSELESNAWHDRVWALGCVYRLLLLLPMPPNPFH